jgi:hypothetical protein
MDHATCELVSIDTHALAQLLAKERGDEKKKREVRGRGRPERDGEKI